MGPLKPKVVAGAESGCVKETTPEEEIFYSKCLDSFLQKRDGMGRRNLQHFNIYLKLYSVFVFSLDLSHLIVFHYNEMYHQT